MKEKNLQRNEKENVKEEEERQRKHSVGLSKNEKLNPPLLLMESTLEREIGKMKEEEREREKKKEEREKEREEWGLHEKKERVCENVEDNANSEGDIVFHNEEKKKREEKKTPLEER